ncbi:MAG: hypothetical protein ACREUW_18900, partial [Burkholderiales bacterium]
LEGEAGFYHAFVGNNRGELTYSFDGKIKTDLGAVAKDLGSEWMMLETHYRIYSISGYNIAHVELAAKLCQDHDIKYEDIDRIEALVNWLETQYPSPAFPVRREDQIHKPGSTSYYLACAAVTRAFPMLREWAPQTASADDPPEALELMQRVTIIPTHEMTLFGPRITIFLKNGKSHTVQGTGCEFIWNFDEQAKRIRPVTSGLPIPESQFEAIIQGCRDLDRHPRADALVRLMLK